MNAIIVDDELSNIENLRALVSKHCPNVNIVGKATDIVEGALLMRSLEPDLLFLDIQIGSDMGFDLLELLHYRDFEVIFITAYDNYGIQAIKFAALDYILKPIVVEELLAAVAKAEIKLKSKRKNQQLDFLLQHLQKSKQLNPKIALPQQQEIRYIEVSDIVHCKADNTYTNFHMVNGEKILISNSLKEYSDLLQPYGFIRSHQSHLINPKYIRSWLKEDGGILLLTTGEKIPVSRPNRERIKYSLGF